MKFLRLVLFPVLILLASCSGSGNRNNGEIYFTGDILRPDSTGLDSCTVTVSPDVAGTQTNVNAGFALSLSPETDYVITVTRRGYAPAKLAIYTGPGDASDSLAFQLPAIRLMPQLPGKDLRAFDEPYAKYRFTAAGIAEKDSAFYDDVKNMQRGFEAEALLQFAAQKPRYDADCARADSAFAAGNYTLADSLFTKAEKELFLNGEDSYAKQGITRAHQQEMGKEKFETTYTVLLGQAALFYDNKAWKEAAEKYQAASALAPDREFPEKRRAGCIKNMMMRK